MKHKMKNEATYLSLVELCCFWAPCLQESHGTKLGMLEMGQNLDVWFC